MDRVVTYSSSHIHSRGVAWIHELYSMVDVVEIKRSDHNADFSKTVYVSTNLIGQ